MLPNHSLSLMEVRKGFKQCGTCKQWLMQRLWRSAASWLVHRGLFSLLSYETHEHLPRMAPPTVVHHLPHPSLTNKAVLHGVLYPSPFKALL